MAMGSFGQYGQTSGKQLVETQKKEQGMTPREGVGSGPAPSPPVPVTSPDAPLAPGYSYEKKGIPWGYVVVGLGGLAALWLMG